MNAIANCQGELGFKPTNPDAPAAAWSVSELPDARVKAFGPAALSDSELLANLVANGATARAIDGNIDGKLTLYLTACKAIAAAKGAS